MSARTFVDTNVLVYAVDTADPRKQSVALELIAERRADLVLSAQVLAEFYAVATRRLSPPLPEPDAAAAIDDLRKLPTVAIDGELVRNGISISQDARLSFWDGLIVAAARAAGCDTLVTEDLSAGATIAGVQIENPF